MSELIGPVNWPRPKYDWENMSLEDLRATWMELNERFTEICEQISSLDPDIPSAKAMPLTRQYWAHVEILLSGHMELMKLDLRLDPPPFILINQLRLVAGSLAVGTAPRFIEDAVRPGSAAPTPRARDNIAYGLAYLLAARSGMVEDPSPVRSVAEAFEVSEKTVRNWASDSERFYPSRRIALDGPYLAEKMPEHGKAYSVKSRLKNGGRKTAR